MLMSKLYQLLELMTQWVSVVRMRTIEPQHYALQHVASTAAGKQLPKLVSEPKEDR
jgi:hypothetical protein